MAITSAEIAALTNFTVAEKITWVEYQMMEAARAERLGVGNREIVHQRFEELRSWLADLKEEQQLDAAGDTMGIALAEFGEEA